MKKRKIKRNVGFSLHSEALPFASTTLGFTPLFLESQEVLGKAPARSMASLGFPCGELGQRGDFGLQGHTGCW